MEQLILFETKEEKESRDIRELRGSGDPTAFAMLREDISMALLHQDAGKYRLIDKVIEQAREKGLSYVLCKISDEARRFRNLARQVKSEYHKAISFIRLQPIDLPAGRHGQHRVLFGEFELKHQTAEMIMLHFMKRFPKFNIMLVFGEDAYIGRNNEIFKDKVNRQKIHPHTKDFGVGIKLPKTIDVFERYWLAFYRSQFIVERKNLRYLKRMIPKKYWPWVTELKEFGLA